MTILEKQGPSTAGPDSEDDQSGQRYPSEKQLPPSPTEPGGLPSYADSTSSTQPQASTSRVVPPGFPPATNHVYISHRNGKISDNYAIDTSMDVPVSLLRPLEQGETQRQNLLLHTGNGTIGATVALVSGTAQRVLIKLDTGNGKIEFKMSYRSNAQPFKLHAKTRNGEILVSLPRDYAGPLRYRTRNGKIKFSDGLQTVVKSFTNDTSFVGDWQTTGFVDFEKWEGDEVEIETANGKIKFMYHDEEIKGDDNWFREHPFHHHPHGMPPHRGFPPHHGWLPRPGLPPMGFPHTGFPNPGFPHVGPFPFGPQDPQAPAPAENEQGEPSSPNRLQKRGWFGR